MVVMHIEIKAKPERVAFVEIALAEVAADVRQQDGCLEYQWLRKPGSPAEFVVYAEFESRAAFDAYREGRLVRKIELEMLPLIAEPPRYKHLEATVIEQGGPIGPAE